MRGFCPLSRLDMARVFRGLRQGPGGAIDPPEAGAYRARRWGRVVGVTVGREAVANRSSYHADGQAALMRQLRAARVLAPIA
jgi:hypothetical protein